METSDQDFIAQYRAGNVAALDALVEKYRRPLFGYILNMVGGRDDADDIFQEAWFKAIRKLHTYRHKNFFGWLVRITHNVVIDRVRRQKPVVSLDAESETGQSVMDTLTDGQQGPADLVEDGELGQRIAAAVATLPVEQKDVFLMRVKTGLSFKEIAKIQKTSINTALARMQYALTKLRPLLKTDYEALASHG